MSEEMNDFCHAGPIEALASGRGKLKNHPMGKILRAFRQSFESLLSLRMALLVVIPPVIAVLLVLFLFIYCWSGWSLGLTHFFQALGPMNWLQNATGINELSMIIAMIALVLLFIPFAYLAAVIFTSVFVMPVALKWVVDADFKGLQRKRGGSTVGSLWNTLMATVIFIVLFFVTLPLWFLPGCQVLIPLLLTAWLNKRVFMYDVLQDFASTDERKWIEKNESHNLFGMGMLLGLLSYIPLAVFIIPVVSALSYSYYGLNELSRLRGSSQS